MIIICFKSFFSLQTEINLINVLPKCEFTKKSQTIYDNYIKTAIYIFI